MRQPIPKSSLSIERRRLVELHQRLNFGTVELNVRGGEPVFDPAPRIIEMRKMGAPNGPRAESDLQDFCLKQQVVELFETMDEIGDGVLSITVKHGLPFSIEVERKNGW